MELPSSPAPSPPPDRSMGSALQPTPISPTTPTSLGQASVPASSPTVSENLSALTRLRGHLMLWLVDQNPPEGSSPQPLTSHLADSLRRYGKESLEEVMLRVLGNSGGEAKLLAVLRDLPRPAALNMLKSALNLAQNHSGPDAIQASTTSFLRLLIRTFEDGTRSARPLDATHPGHDFAREAGRQFTGQARIIDKEWLGDLASGTMTGKEAGGPLARLRLYDGQKVFSLLAPEAPPLGTPVTYSIGQGQGVAHPASAASSGLQGHVTSQLPSNLSAGSVSGLALPVALESAYGLASPQGRLALGIAQDMLGDLADQPYFARAVQDFARVLEASGFMHGSAASFQPATKAELNALLKLWIDSPLASSTDSTASPNASSPVLPNEWVRGFAQGLRQPQSLLAALRLLKPASAEIPNPSQDPHPPQTQPQAQASTSPGNANSAASTTGLFLKDQTLLVPANAAARSQLVQALGLKDVGPEKVANFDRGLTVEQWARLDAERAINKALNAAMHSGETRAGSQALSQSALQSGLPGTPPLSAEIMQVSDLQSAGSATNSHGSPSAQAQQGGPMPGIFQALAFALRPEAQNLSADPNMQLFYYQEPGWYRVMVNPDSRRQGQSSDEGEKRQGRRGRSGSEGSSWQAQVDWKGDFLGQAMACVKLVASPAESDADKVTGGDAPTGIDLLVEHEGPFAQLLMSHEIPRLEAALGMQGLSLAGWRYQHKAPSAPTQVQPLPTSLLLTSPLPGPTSSSPPSPPTPKSPPPHIDLRF
jgi:hypothetical protein